MPAKHWYTPLCACALALTCEPLLAQESRFSRLIVFGDSLADAGQATDPAGPAGSTLRYTNRTGPDYQTSPYALVSSQRLGQRLGLPEDGLQASSTGAGTNYAVGGWRTDEIQASLGNGAAIDPNALYYLTGGGNDFLQFRVLSARAAATAAGRLVDSVQTLHEGGAQTLMVWMLPDIGLTPALNGGVFQSTASRLSAAFNQSLLDGLQAGGANVIALNLPLLLSDALERPAEFGLARDQDLVGTCFNGDGCTENARFGISSATPDPRQLLFNDSVHPTESGQQLIADYAYSILAAPSEISLLPRMAQASLNSHQAQLRSHAQGDWQALHQWQALVAGGNDRLHLDDSRGHDRQLLLGTTRRLSSHWRAGLALGNHQQHLRAGEADSRYRVDGQLGSLLVNYRSQRAWFNGAITAGRLDFSRLNRAFSLNGQRHAEAGATTGRLRAVSAEAGINLRDTTASWNLAPFLSSDYSRTDVRGYREQGETATALSFGQQQQRSSRWGVGVKGQYQAGASTLLFAEYAHQRERHTDARALQMALNSVPGLDFALKGIATPERSNRWQWGIRQHLTSQLALTGSYQATQGKGHRQQGAHLALDLAI